MRPREPLPFRAPPVGRLFMKAVRDDAFGAEWLVVVDRLPEPPTEDMRLTGTLRGPRCAHATTLPVTAALVPIPPPSGLRGLVARVVLTEPASWTPDLPNRYLLESRIEGGGRCDPVWQEPFGGFVGLRRLGGRGRSFRLDGRRFVLRGGLPGSSDSTRNLSALRGRRRAVVLEAGDPWFATSDTLDAADGEGVFVVSLFDQQEAGKLAAQLSLHPAAAFAIARDRAAAEAFGLHRTPSGPLLGLSVDGGAPPPSNVAGVDFLAVHLAADAVPHEAWMAQAPPLPLVACRPVAGDAAERDPSDRLQASLAKWGAGLAGPVLPWDWAGYLSS